MGDTPRQRVLVVEDEPRIARILREYLEASGLEVHTEDTGEAALEWAQAHRPNLVILDLMLPDVNGFEVCERLREQFSREAMPVLMLTALAGPGDRDQGYAVGANAYIAKPFEPGALMPIVEQLLAQTKSS